MTGTHPPRRRHTIAWAFMALAAMVLSLPASAREIIDMVGRTVEIPDHFHPHAIYGTEPPVTDFLYSLDPGLLAGWNFPLSPRDKPYVAEKSRDLPVLGAWFMGRQVNVETLMATHPQMALIWLPWVNSPVILEELKRLGIPAVGIRLEHLADYPAAYRFLGGVIGQEARAGQLADYIENILQRLAKMRAAIPARERVSVYYAEGPDGLRSDCDGSVHTEALRLAGARNVFHCVSQSLYGMEKVSMGQVLAWNPQVIVTSDRTFLARVYKDPAWKPVRAVREHRVYFIPTAPFNWFDRPPSFMLALGAQWLAHLLYPQAYPLDMNRTVKDFYRLFLRVEPSDAQVREVMAP